MMRLFSANYGNAISFFCLSSLKFKQQLKSSTDILILFFLWFIKSFVFIFLLVPYCRDLSHIPGSQGQASLHLRLSRSRWQLGSSSKVDYGRIPTYTYIYIYCIYYKDISMEVLLLLLLLLLLLAMGGIVLGNFISLMFEDTEKETAKKTEGGICINQNFQRSNCLNFVSTPEAIVSESAEISWFDSLPAICRNGRPFFLVLAWHRFRKLCKRQFKSQVVRVFCVELRLKALIPQTPCG